jgi:hypothetical protein
MVCLLVHPCMYRLNNCCHELCLKCTRILRAQYENPWKTAGICPAPPNLITCPMCRTVEQMVSIAMLARLYPAAYMYWFQHKCFATTSFIFEKEREKIRYTKEFQKRSVSKYTKKRFFL